MALITSPLDITGCNLWLDAGQGLFDQLGNPVTTNGDSIVQWRDQSGNNNHVTCFTGTNPTLATNVSITNDRVKNVVRFGGAGRFVGGDILDLGTNHGLIFAVFKVVGTSTSSQHILSKNYGTGLGDAGTYTFSRRGSLDSPPNALRGFCHTNGHNISTFVDPCSSQYTIACYNIVRGGATSGNPMYVRGNRYFTSTGGASDNNFNANTPGFLTIGGANNADGFSENNYLTGDICEVGMYIRNAAYTESEINELETYLYNKWISSSNPVIFDCKVWLDAGDSSTLFRDRLATVPASVTTPNQEVACWKNKANSGYGNFTALASQTITQMPSARVSPANSLSAIYFPGGALNAQLSLAAADQTVATGGFRHQAQTVFVATAPHATNYDSASRIFTTNLTPAGVDTAGVIPLYQSALATASTYADGSPRASLTISPGKFQVLTSRVNSTDVVNTRSGMVSAFYAGTTFAEISSYGMRLGAVIPAGGITTLGTSSRYCGDISEVLVYDRVLTNEECHRVEYYLAKKWNIPEGNFVYATKNGNWSEVSTWSALDYPARLTDVYANGKQITVNENVNIQSFNAAPLLTRPYFPIADNGSFLVTQPYTLNATPSSNSHFTIIAGSAPCLNLNVNTGVATITGNVISGSTTTGYGIIQSGTSPIILDGNVIARQADGFQNLAGQSITITKTISGGILDDAYGLYNQAPFCNITVLSGVTSGTGTRCAGISSLTTGNLTISGNLIAGPGLSACVVFSPYTSNISISGNISAGTNTNASGVVCITAADIDIIGNIRAGAGLSAFGLNVQRANDIDIIGNITGGSNTNSSGVQILTANNVFLSGNIIAGQGTSADGVLISYSSSITLIGSLSGGSGSLAAGLDTLSTKKISISGINIAGGAGLSACGAIIPYADDIVLDYLQSIRGGAGTDSCGVFCLSSSGNLVINASIIGGANSVGNSGVGAIGVRGPLTTGTVSVTGYIGGGVNTNSAGLVLYNYGSTTCSGSAAVGGWGNNVVNNHGITNFNSTVLTIVGNVSGGWSGGTNPSPNSCGIRNLAARHVEIIGNVSGGDGSPSTGVLDTSATYISIKGSVYGGRGADSTGLNTTSAVLTSVWVSGNDMLGRTGYAIDFNSQANPVSDTFRTVIGNNIRGGTLAAVRGSRVGKTTIIGNITGSTSTGNTIVNTMGSIDIIGNVTGNSSAPSNAGAVIVNEFTGTVSITGNLTASTNQPALYSPYMNGLNFINGSIINNATNGRQAVRARSYFITPNMFNGYITHATDTGSTITFYAPQSYPVTHLPPMSSVQAGVEYAAITQLSGKSFITTNQLTGNMVVPSVSSVAFGVPVGIDVGKVRIKTDDLTQTLNIDLTDPALSQPNTFAQKMKETCTKQTVIESVKFLVGVST